MRRGIIHWIEAAPDAALDLAAVFQMTCERGQYGRLLDYGEVLNLPLGEQKLRWAAEQVGAARGG